MNENEHNSDIHDNSHTDTCDQSRRDAMKKMGKYAVYTAPAMLTLLASKNSMAGAVMSLN
jgi:hypothetical protein